MPSAIAAILLKSCLIYTKFDSVNCWPWNLYTSIKVITQ